jgi:hypothetical protein
MQSSLDNVLEMVLLLYLSIMPYALQMPLKYFKYNVQAMPILTYYILTDLFDLFVGVTNLLSSA